MLPDSRSLSARLKTAPAAPPLSRAEQRRAAPARALLGLFILLLLAGCTGGSDAVVPPTVPVKGKVTAEGQPVSSGQVTFVQESTDDKYKFRSPSGQIDSSGNYELFTEGKAGAPEGKYKVMVTPSMVPVPGAKAAPKAPFNPKYQNAKFTPLDVEVKSGTSSYDLKLSH